MWLHKLPSKYDIKKLGTLLNEKVQVMRRYNVAKEVQVIWMLEVPEQNGRLKDRVSNLVLSTPSHYVELALFSNKRQREKGNHIFRGNVMTYNKQWLQARENLVTTKTVLWILKRMIIMAVYLLTNNTQNRYKADMNEAKVILSWGGKNTNRHYI